MLHGTLFRTDTSRPTLRIAALQNGQLRLCKVEIDSLIVISWTLLRAEVQGQCHWNIRQRWRKDEVLPENSDLLLTAVFSGCCLRCCGQHGSADSG
jgi:hypothetical protein